MIQFVKRPENFFVALRASLTCRVKVDAWKFKAVPSQEIRLLGRRPNQNMQVDFRQTKLHIY